MCSNENLSVANCSETQIPEGQKMPSAWNWLEESQFVVYTEGNNTYQSWKLHTPYGSLQLVVKDAEAQRPYLLIRIDNVGDVERKIFTVYEEVIPPDSIFTIPIECYESKHTN